MSIDLFDAILRIAAAAGLAGIIGLEREIAQKEAGLRTHMLVGLGAGVFAYLGIEAFPSGPGTDPARVAAQIVTGIGFLGAGAIVRYGPSVQGLTTAAGLWTAAAVGLAAGMAEYELAVIATGVALIVLYLVGVTQWLLRGRTLEASIRLRVRLASTADIDAARDAIGEIVSPAGWVEIEDVAADHTMLLAHTTPDAADATIRSVAGVDGVTRVSRASR